MVQIASWKLMGTASKPVFHRVCIPDHEFAWQVRGSRVTTVGRLEICT